MCVIHGNAGEIPSTALGMQQEAVAVATTILENQSIEDIFVFFRTGQNRGSQTQPVMKMI